MPRTITKTIYTFQELLDAAKNKEAGISSRAVDKARTWLQESISHYDWWDNTYEVWTEALKSIGLMKPDISFSGFWSQGDGASFTCEYVDMEKFVPFMARDIEPKECIDFDGTKEIFEPWLVHKIGGKVHNPKYLRLLKTDINANVSRISSRYSHEFTCRFTAEFHNARDRFDGGTWVARTPRALTLLEAFEDEAEQVRRDLCRAIYNCLEKEYEYLTSDECLIEDSDANDYTFDSYGDRDG